MYLHLLHFLLSCIHQGDHDVGTIVFDMFLILFDSPCLLISPASCCLLCRSVTTSFSSMPLFLPSLLPAYCTLLVQDPKAPRNSRIASTMGEIGPPIVLGATTTMLGVLPLSFANSELFRSFFKIFITIVALGVRQCSTRN